MKSYLESGWSQYLEGLTIRHEENGVTVIPGPIAYHAALVGMLGTLLDLSLKLISVNLVRPILIAGGNEPNA